MVKSIAALTIDSEIWQAARIKYPRQVSAMVEEFLANILSETIHV